MRKSLRYLIFIIIIAVVAGIVIGANLLDKNSKPAINLNSNSPVTANVVYEPVKLTKDNLPGFLQSQALINDIPKNGVILLKLYNFDSGSRTWEENYVIEKASVKKGSVDNPDVILSIHSKYVSELGDFCNAIKTARANGDFGFESGMSEAALLWKYKGMMKYKNCFGL